MKRLVVVGDALLDADVIGHSERLCPEAPAPVVDADTERARPGGAGLAAVLAARDAADVHLITAIADDPPGRRLKRLLQARVDVTPLPMRGSTVRKTRIRSDGQLIARVDQGDGRADTEADLPEAAASALAEADAVLVADYGRGLTEHHGLRRALDNLASIVPVVWDPHPKGAMPIRGTAIVVPNAAEAARLAPRADSAAAAAEYLRGTFGSGAVAVTQGALGATLATAEQTVRVPAPWIRDGHWVDTCGAGDQFSAATATALLYGRDVHGAVAAAVEAASRFVAEGGVATLAEPAAARTPPDEPDLNGAAEIGVDPFALAERVRERGGVLVAAGGCFDLLHPGHIDLLRRARDMGDALIVCINSDASVRELKGPGRPVQTAADRARVLAALDAVDAVAVFDEPTPADLLERLRPSIWVKGADYAGQVLPEAAVVRRHGGEIVTVPAVDGHSTSALIAAAYQRT
ncbi:PfkB family carbohydrate kinase [Glycomyces albidus]|uniref:Adenylyltransferase/cytidyltransferase family protein n=1 Tax=Glycomyces albidus TaxID=2656774 RepID=A0A6L5G7J5_9ACTN|nr:PfkB family carbohydrate kinase [Glycomyces albidus]MQM25630.1 adenylyltransferase/cytidyltransferase family protein [Glycomyces albidus]